MNRTRRNQIKIDRSHKYQILFGCGDGFLSDGGVLSIVVTSGCCFCFCYGFVVVWCVFVIVVFVSSMITRRSDSDSHKGPMFSKTNGRGEGRTCYLIIMIINNDRRKSKKKEKKDDTN